MDGNKFKKINDSFGHSTGDRALCDTAAILTNVCKKYGQNLFLCRFGGDEFVIVGKELRTGEADNIVSYIRAETERYTAENRRRYHLSLSVGYVTDDCTTYAGFERTLQAADAAMYEDKKSRALNI